MAPLVLDMSSSHLDVRAENLCIGGIDIQLYRTEVQSVYPVVIVYLLHGRLRSKEKVRDFARKLVLKGAGYEEGKRTLWVITFVCLLGFIPTGDSCSHEVC